MFESKSNDIKLNVEKNNERKFMLLKRFFFYTYICIEKYNASETKLENINLYHPDTNISPQIFIFEQKASEKPISPRIKVELLCTKNYSQNVQKTCDSKIKFVLRNSLLSFINILVSATSKAKKCFL